MREKDEINSLFRSRLSDAEMTVREGFWETLQQDLLSQEAGVRKCISLSPGFYRVVAAASVVFALGAVSAAFWYFSPKEEIKEAFTQVAVMTPEGNLNGDVVQENFPPVRQASSTAHRPGMKQPADCVQEGSVKEVEDESVSLHVSITITERVYGNDRQQESGFYDYRNSVRNVRQTSTDGTNANSDIDSPISVDDKQVAPKVGNMVRPRNWAVKIAFGSSLPKRGGDMPFTAAISAEHRLNSYLGLEAGLQYNCLPADRTLHTLAIPVKLNATFASSPKVNFYATLGGAIEKCIAGASDNSFKAEPVQLSVMAGIGARYKVNDRFALFAEPSVSHHFDTDSPTKSLRTERPVNLNLLCGVRMTY
ncbi:outer membrane beta-barrel protein [Bacteroides helcogenes]|uniref:Uncharacterized protein n=1 Tax=Bacteroides helcogenes (strain ATCC 35417 / DSM 20613 / JCM 6297 / CCUG 15421 / P 36-108) TaxID=693979 RepID=E6SQA6_BACT6|nr:outer membrane beta-barrel protein [Bacteroides helcogenes]ADV43965.1 hypothetical protein Bache_1988 [Bacteroides helcogenes P 36-108]MDY5236897.1 outer membrane beta-barrel protein [Bacteroides helcogenes]